MMDIFTITLIAIGLSFDSFAVSVSCGLILNKIKFIQALRFALLLAIFQGLMPILGWIIGTELKNYIVELDHWIAFILLSIVGIKMILDSKKHTNEKTANPLSLLINLTLAFATSIDALIAGLSFAFFNINIYITIFIIASITFIVSMLGVLFGKKTGSKLGKRMEQIGGVILIGIGSKILSEHLFF